MNFCIWNFMPISKNREKRSSVIEVQITVYIAALFLVKSNSNRTKEKGGCFLRTILKLLMMDIHSPANHGSSGSGKQIY